MPKYPFLSDEWLDAAKRIYAEAGPVLGAGGEATPVKVNLVVSDVPFSASPLTAHLDTTAGTVEIGSGHLPAPDVTVSTDYVTARALFTSGDVQAVMQAFLSGRIRVDGNLNKLLDPKSGIWPSGGPAPRDAQAQPSPAAQAALSFAGPLSAKLADRLQEITQ